MSETKIVWKAVGICDEGYKSLSTPLDKGGLIYTVGEVTIPEFGLVLTYDSKDKALLWARALDGAVLECEGYGCERIGTLCRLFNLEGIMKFWDGDWSYPMYAPKGTIGCRSVKVLKVVYDRRMR